MSKQVYEGKSVEEALGLAAEELGVAVSELEHELVEEKNDDFWGLGETVYHVRAWLPGSEPAPERTPESTPAPTPDPAPETPPAAAPPPFFTADPAPAAVEPRASAAAPTPPPPVAAPAAPRRNEPVAVASDQGIEEAAVALLGRIFDSMEFDCSVEAEVDGGTLQISISGDDNQYLLDGRGRGLSALELILNHAFRHRPDIGQKKIRVDAGDFRSQRDDEIRDLAYQVAHRAKETGEAQQTEPMNPYERRIVHLTLADDGQVTTRSEGSGFLKAVNVIPKHGQR